MSKIQKILFWCSKEGTGIWDVLLEIQSTLNCTKEEAYTLLNEEIDFLKNSNIFLLKSKNLYDNSTLENINLDNLKLISILELMFNEKGPFYYISDDLKI